jgi:hypothetical protein
MKDQMLVASQGSGVASMLRPLLGVQSGFFSTAEGRLRSHLKAVQKAHGEKLTKEEKVNILLKTPLVAMDLLPDKLKRRAYEASRRRAIPLYRCNVCVYLSVRPKSKEEISQETGDSLGKY